MALPPNLPPQAYTRDTLVKAIEWLTTQPAAVRERANSADLIVSHFLASRRRTPYVNEAAMMDFKTLAEDIRQGDEPAYLSAPSTGASTLPEMSTVTSTATAGVATTAAENLRGISDEPIPEYTPPAPSPPARGRRREAPRAGGPAGDAFAAAAVAHAYPAPSADAPPSNASNSPTATNAVGPARGTPEGELTTRGFTWTVDQRSRTIAREVQDRMNLSSESEALRMLVAMGAERLRSVLP